VPELEMQLTCLALLMSFAPEAEAAPSAEPEEPAVDLESRMEAIERDNEALREELSAIVREREQERASREEEARSAEADAERLQREVEALRHEQEALRKRARQRARPRVQVGGYLDAGFFWVAGDGAGTRTDGGFDFFPEYDGVIRNDGWVFMGDPLSTAINSRGDPADRGESSAVQFDSIRSQGNPTFIVNNLNVSLFAALGKQVTVDGLVDFLPRGRDVSRGGDTFLGDFVDVKLANLRWFVPVTSFGLELQVGKVDSVFGREYRRQEAPDRTTVTPSLLCRYTCGRPIGIKSRWSFLPSRALMLNLSLTNGSPMQELFGFADEIDSNFFKTAAGRLSYKLPVGAGLEIGASGLAGAQDLQPFNDTLHWQYGVDLHLDIRGLEVTGEFLQGKLQGRDAADGTPCGQVACLRFMGAYGLVGYRITNWLMPFFRTDWRDALHQNGDLFVYISQLVRFTTGVRFELGEHVIVKGEYTVNRELGRIPQFPNDIFTSSVVGRF
jgi:hypothetical protein